MDRTTYWITTLIVCFLFGGIEGFAIIKRNWRLLIGTLIISFIFKAITCTYLALN